VVVVLGLLALTQRHSEGQAVTGCQHSLLGVTLFHSVRTLLGHVGSLVVVGALRTPLLALQGVTVAVGLETLTPTTQPQARQALVAVAEALKQGTRVLAVLVL
jgi:hypothetical protein